MTPPFATPSPDAQPVQLKADVSAATQEVADALRTYGEGARPTRNAQERLRLATRALEREEFRRKERERTDELSPAQIADRVRGSL